MNRKLELIAARVALVGIALVATASLLGGCTQMESQLGGKVLGASVTLAGVTVSLSGTIPTAAAPSAPGENPSNQAAPQIPPASK